MEIARRVRGGMSQAVTPYVSAVPPLTRAVCHDLEFRCQVINLSLLPSELASAWLCDGELSVDDALSITDSKCVNVS